VLLNKALPATSPFNCGLPPNPPKGGRGGNTHREDLQIISPGLQKLFAVELVMYDFSEFYILNLHNNEKVS
jgi:hypothetical protein